MNKILLVAALATTILGSMITIQTAEAYCPEDNPGCCPPHMIPLCDLEYKQSPIPDDLFADRLTFDKFVYQSVLLDGFRTTKLLEASQVQQAQIVNLQKEIDSMKGVLVTDGRLADGVIITEGKVDRYSGGIIIDSLIIGLLGAVITIGIVNLLRKR